MLSQPLGEHIVRQLSLTNRPKKYPHRFFPRDLMTLAVCLVSLAACGSLPNSGPTESEVLKSQRDPQKNNLGFGIVQISADLLTLIASENATPLSSLEEEVTSQHGSNDEIGAGDILQISVYELGSAIFSGGGSNVADSPTAEALAGAGGGSGSSSNLLMSNTSSTRSGTTATLSNLPPMVVSGHGTIDVPYVGKLYVIGKTTDTVAAEIKAALTKKSQAPQVLVRLVQSLTNSAIIYGDVKKPGRIVLTPNRECLLDIIALAQGSTHASEDSVIQLTRAGHVVRVPMSVPETDPSQNIQIQPGDRVEVIYKPRSFTVFGAAGTVTEKPFAAPELSLAEAIARVGGPADGKADPNGIFLLRYEDNNIVQRLGLPTSPGSPVTPIVYQIDMMNPGNYFLAQHFVMKDKDMLYFSNAKANEFYKLFGLISTIIQPGITAGYMAR